MFVEFLSPSVSQSSWVKIVDFYLENKGEKTGGGFFSLDSELFWLFELFYQIQQKLHPTASC